MNNLTRAALPQECVFARPGLISAATWKVCRSQRSPLRLRGFRSRGYTPSRHCPAVRFLPKATAAPQAAPEAQRDAADTPFDWNNHWFPVVYTHDIGEGELYPFTLLGQPIVIWKDPTHGKYRAFRDACPHRLVPLSEGRIAESGCLECPYHGWQWSGDGSCTSMPQGGDPSSPRSAATAYQCAEKQGMIWVKLQPASSDNTNNNAQISTDAIPIIPELEDAEWFEGAPMWRDLPMDYATLIENVVDVGHVAFTHHASVSKRQSSGSFEDMKVEERGDWGFTGVWPTGPRRGSLGAQMTLFQGPALMRHTIDAFDTRGFANITAVYGTPTTPGRCRLIVRQPFKFKSAVPRLAFKVLPKFLAHLGALSVLDDDNIFLHLQERELVERGVASKPIGQVYNMPGASDSYVAAFRLWLSTVAGGGPFGPQNTTWLSNAGPRLSKDDLLDHYHSHTERCSICSTALRRIKVIRNVARALAVVGSNVAISAAALHFAAAAAAPANGAALQVAGWGGAVAVIAGLVWAWCAKTLPRFFKGVHPPPRNLVPGEWAP